MAALEKSVSGSKIFYPITDESAVRAYIAESRVFIVQMDGRAVGVVSYKIESSGDAHIMGLITSPQHQRLGIGKTAMEFVMGKLEGAKRAYLTVHPDNTPAIKLYEKLGFKVESRAENYFGDGEPRLVLAKILG